MTTTIKHRLPAEALTTLHDHAQRALEAHAIVPSTFHDSFQSISASLMAAAHAHDIHTVAQLLAKADAVLSTAAKHP